MTDKNMVFAVLAIQIVILGAIAPIVGMPMFCLVTVNGAASITGSAFMYATMLYIAWLGSRMVE